MKRAFHRRYVRVIQSEAALLGNPKTYAIIHARRASLVICRNCFAWFPIRKDDPKVADYLITKCLICVTESNHVQERLDMHARGLMAEYRVNVKALKERGEL